MSEEQRLWIPCESIRLDGALWLPEVKGLAPGVVLCHPHPLNGGNMHSDVVLGIRNALVARGLAVLRFNFRGVGRSEGEHGEGVEELDDVRAALSVLAAVPAVDSADLSVVGYSFGAWVGLRAASGDPRARRLVAVAPPLTMCAMDELFASNKPKLAVVGSRDEFCPAEQFETWFGRLAEPKLKAVVQGADHFFWGREGEVGDAVAGYLAQRP